MNTTRLAGTLLAALAALLLGHGSLAAQICDAPQPGTAVRLVHEREVPAGAGGETRQERTHYAEATFAGFDGDSVRVELATGPAAFHRSEVTRFEAPCPSGLMREVGSGFLDGAVAGGVIGLVAGLCNPDVELFSDDHDCRGPNARSLVVGAGVGAAAGAILGAVLSGVHAVVNGGRSWRGVPLVAPGDSPEGGWLVGLRIPLGG